MLTSAAIDATDRRLHKRYRCSGAASLACIPSLAPAAARLYDISTAGCALHLLAPDTFDLGALVELRILSPYLAFRALGQVRCTCLHGRLVRLRYVNLNLRGLNDILTFIRDEESRLTEGVPFQPARITLTGHPLP